VEVLGLGASGLLIRGLNVDSGESRSPAGVVRSGLSPHNLHRQNCIITVYIACACIPVLYNCLAIFDLSCCKMLKACVCLQLYHTPILALYGPRAGLL